MQSLIFLAQLRDCLRESSKVVSEPLGLPTDQSLTSDSIGHLTGKTYIRAGSAAPGVGVTGETTILLTG